ncbi:hypothetical protein BLOT_016366 [Blomia tropicalis]|nr:hypothetical protein BLOT_016366 [Blomia tropicalis]
MFSTKTNERNGEGQNIGPPLTEIEEECESPSANVQSTGRDCHQESASQPATRRIKEQASSSSSSSSPVPVRSFVR